MNNEVQEERELPENEDSRMHTTGEGSDRFQTIVAILIAIVSVVSAGVAWRASMAGSSGSSVDREGLDTTMRYEAAYALTVSALHQEARYAAQYTRYQARVDALESQDGPAARSEAEGVREIVEVLALFTPLATDSDYHTSDGRLDLDRRLDDLRAADADLRDLDPQQEFDTADQFYTETLALVSIVVLFALSLFFLTLAEITRHKLRLGLAAVGVVIFIVGLGGVLVTELYFVLSRLVAA